MIAPNKKRGVTLHSRYARVTGSTMEGSRFLPTVAPAARSRATRNGLRVKLDPQCPRYLKDGRKAGIAFTRKRLVQAFTAKPGITGKLSHALSASDGAQRLSDKGRVVARLFNTGFEIQRHILFGFEVVGAVPFAKFDSTHNGLLEFFGQLERGLNVFVLAGLVTARQQDNQFVPTLNEVHPVAGAVINPQFRYAFANGLTVAIVTLFGPINPRLYAHRCPPVTQSGKPIIEQRRGKNTFHAESVPFGIQIIGQLVAPRNAQHFPTIANRKPPRYSAAVAANSATGFGDSITVRRISAITPKAGAFFMPATSFYGGCARDTFGYAGCLTSRFANPRTAATQYRLATISGGSSTLGAVPMNHIHAALKNRAAAHKAMAFAALRADSSASVRLGRYRKHITRSRTLLALAGVVGGEA